MENGLHGHLGQAAVPFAVEAPKAELEIVPILDHHQGANTALVLALISSLVMMTHVYMVQN
jgi:hypothetical protein